MDVRVVHEAAAAECSEADYVRVSTWCDPEQDTVTLATIQRVVHRHLDDARSTSPERVETQRVKTLISKQPMSPDHALGLARSYAQRKRISLVLSDVSVADHAPSSRESDADPG
jgi:hypothetical protein